MNTTDNHSNPLSLQELQQRKHALETQRNKWTGTLIVLISAIYAIEYILEQFLTEDAVTRIIGILLMIWLLFMGYFAVKITKWTWAVNDLDREIKKIDKHHIDHPEKNKKPTSGFFSTPHHSWGEKVAKALGIIILLFFLSLSTIKLLGSFELIHYDFPQLFKANYTLVLFTLIWIGSILLRYRSDLSLVSRISIWSAVILLLTGLPLLYMEYKMGGWMLFLAFIMSVINLFRYEKEVHFLKQC